MPSNHLIVCCPLLLLSSVLPNIRVFSNESVLCIRWPKYWSVSFSIIPSNEYSGLISFRTDWLDLLAVQWALKSPLAPQFESIRWTFHVLNLVYRYEDLTPNEISQSQKDKWCIIHLDLVSKVFKFIETGSRIMVTRGWGEGEMGSCCLMAIVPVLHEKVEHSWTV